MNPEGSLLAQESAHIFVFINISPINLYRVDKAKPYLLPTPEKDKAIHVQKVKFEDEGLADVIDIKTIDGKQAIAEYKTTYKNVNGFSALTNINFNQESIGKGYNYLDKKILQSISPIVGAIGLRFPD